MKKHQIIGIVLIIAGISILALSIYFPVMGSGELLFWLLVGGFGLATLFGGINIFRGGSIARVLDNLFYTLP